MDSDVLLSELYPTLGTEQEADVGAVASGLLDVEPLSHELGWGWSGTQSSQWLCDQGRACVPVGTGREEVALPTGLVTLAQNLSLSNGCLATRWEMLASCPLGEQPTCWGQSEICVRGRVKSGVGFLCHWTRWGKGVGVIKKTITVTISLLTYKKICMCCSALRIISGDSIIVS